MTHIVVMNVFFAPNSYGGATIVAENVAQKLVQDHGCQVSAISMISRSDLHDYSVIKTEKNGIVNFVINLPKQRSYAEIYDNPQVTELVARLLEQLQPDLAHIHCVQDLGIGALSAARRLNVPTVLSVHDFWWICERQFMIRPNQRYCAQNPVQIENCRGCVDGFSRAKLRFDLLQAEAAKVDLITFPSQFAHDLSIASGMRAARTLVWPNGIRLPKPDFFDRQAARRAADPRVAFGFVGGPTAIKGWPLIKEAFETLPRDGFAGYLVDGSLDTPWWKGVDLSGLQGDWQVLARFSQDELDTFYAKIDVLLFPSQWKETFGLAIREALARGVRVIQTDSGGTTEWPGADRSKMLTIGEGPDQLQAAILAELDRTDRHTDPVPLTSIPDQAQSFMNAVAPLLSARQS